MLRKKSNSTSNSIYYLSKHLPNEFMVSVASFVSSQMQHDVEFSKLWSNLESNSR